MQCPQCQGDYPYQDQGQWVCPECGHEWDEQTTEETEVVYRDSVGNVLAEGDRVTLVKDLKVKGTSQVLKIGTKPRSDALLRAITILIAKSRVPVP